MGLDWNGLYINPTAICLVAGIFGTSHPGFQTQKGGIQGFFTFSFFHPLLTYSLTVVNQSCPQLNPVYGVVIVVSHTVTHPVEL